MSQEGVLVGKIEYVAKNNDGIKLVETGDKWYNYGGVDKANMQKKVSELRQGDLVTLVLVSGQPDKYGDIIVESKAPETPKREAKKYGDSNFMQDYKGIKELLDKAHEMAEGTIEFRTELLHYDFDKKEAVARCTIQAEVGYHELPDGKPALTRMTAQGIGDASPESIGTTNIEPHFIRMAETRAMVRALRWFTNSGETALEEVPGGEEGVYTEEQTVSAEEKQ